MAYFTYRMTPLYHYVHELIQQGAMAAKNAPDHLDPGTSPWRTRR